MPRPSQRDVILQAALHCFAASGYDATRIAHIAEAAGVSAGALYRHYPSKEEVARALFVEHLGAYTSTVQAAIAGEVTTRGKLRAVVRVTLQMYHEQPDAMVFVLIGPRPPIAMPEPYPVDIVAEAMAKGQMLGEVRAGNPRLIAAMFLGCILRPIIIARTPPREEVTFLDAPDAEETIAEGAWAAVAHQR